MLLLLFNQPAVNYTLDCNAGSYSITGQSADLVYTPAAVNYSLDCDAGSYAIVGQTAVLTYTPKQKGKSHDPHKYDFIFDQNLLAKKKVTPEKYAEVVEIAEQKAQVDTAEKQIDDNILSLKSELDRLSNYNKNLSSIVAKNSDILQKRKEIRRKMAELKEQRRIAQLEDEAIMKAIAELL